MRPREQWSEEEMQEKAEAYDVRYAERAPQVLVLRLEVWQRVESTNGALSVTQTKEVEEEDALNDEIVDAPRLERARHGLGNQHAKHDPYDICGRIRQLEHDNRQ